MGVWLFENGSFFFLKMRVSFSENGSLMTMTKSKSQTPSKNKSWFLRRECTFEASVQTAIFGKQAPIFK